MVSIPLWIQFNKTDADLHSQFSSSQSHYGFNSINWVRPEPDGYLIGLNPTMDSIQSERLFLTHAVLLRLNPTMDSIQ